MSMVHRRAASLLLAWLTGIFTLVATMGVALAAEGHGSGEAEAFSPLPLNDLVEAIVNFVLFVGLLYWFGRGPVKHFFEHRSERIASDIERAAELRQQAEAKLAEVGARLEALDQEKAEILKRYREEAETEKELLLQGARREVERIQHDVKTIVQYETDLARQEIRRRIVDEAVDLAAETITRKMDARTENRLLEEFNQSLAPAIGEGVHSTQ